MKKVDYNLHFIDDIEKMSDFGIMTKAEFLESYSYLTEAEYDATKKLYILMLRLAHDHFEKRHNTMKGYARYTYNHGYADAYRDLMIESEISDSDPFMN